MLGRDMEEDRRREIFAERAGIGATPPSEEPKAEAGDEFTDEHCDSLIAEWRAFRSVDQISTLRLLESLKRRNARIRELEAIASKQRERAEALDELRHAAWKRNAELVAMLSAQDTELAELRGREAPEAAYERGLDDGYDWRDYDGDRKSLHEEMRYQPPEPAHESRCTCTWAHPQVGYDGRSPKHSTRLTSASCPEHGVKREEKE
jgi:hypothetical protein